MERTIDWRKNAWTFAVVAGIALWMAASHRGTTVVPADIREVDAQAAKLLIDAGAVVVDVRSADAFANRHIPGALAIPLGELRAAIPSKLAIDRTKPVVIYCGDGVTTGPEGTRVMNQAGFKEAVNLKGGLEGWQRSGMMVAGGR